MTIKLKGEMAVEGTLDPGWMTQYSSDPTAHPVNTWKRDYPCRNACHATRPASSASQIKLTSPELGEERAKMFVMV